MSSSAAGLLPLRTVSRLTGLSADVLRAWEKRYGVVQPERGPRGARLYSGEDVTHLRLLAEAVAAGRSIGDVAHLKQAQLRDLAAEKPVAVEREPSLSAAQHATNAALEAIELFDASRLHRTLSDTLVAMGVIPFLDAVVLPLLGEVGRRWSSGRLSVADEHLVSGVLRGLVSGIIHGRGPNEGQKMMLATPCGERHDFGILMAAMIAIDAGLEVIYLGAEVPGGDIGDAADRCGARVVVLGIVDGDNQSRAVEEVRKTAAQLPIMTELWLGGATATSVAAEVGNSSIRNIGSLQDFRAEVVRLRAESPRSIRAGN